MFIMYKVYKKLGTAEKIAADKLTEVAMAAYIPKFECVSNHEYREVVRVSL